MTDSLCRKRKLADSFIACVICLFYQLINEQLCLVTYASAFIINCTIQTQMFRSKTIKKHVALIKLYEHVTAITYMLQALFVSLQWNKTCQLCNIIRCNYFMPIQTEPCSSWAINWLLWLPSPQELDLLVLALLKPATSFFRTWILAFFSNGLS